MSGLEFAFGVILVLTIAGLCRAQIAAGRRRDRGLASETEESLRGEVEALRQRVGVLERIAVERENSLERQIESLRER